MFKLLFLLPIFLFSSEITAVKSDKIYLDKSYQKGKSGIVLCPYLNKKIICARFISYGSYAKLFPYKEVVNNSFARPNILPKKGDKVLFNFNYNRILIIAPNQKIYEHIKNLYQNLNIIPSDNLATYVDKFDKKNLLSFQRDLNIGRYIFYHKGNIFEIDAFSLYAIKKKKLKIYANYNGPFFTYLKNFGIKNINYLQIFKGIK